MKAALPISFFFLASSALAGSITAALDRNEIALGESTQLELTIEGSFDALTTPQVDGLELHQAGRSEQFQWINGSSNRSTVFTYEVVPTKEGNFDLPPFTAQIDGKKVATLPLKIKVGKGAAAAPNAPPSQDQEEPNTSPSEAVFLEEQLSKKEIYVGEAIVRQVRLMSRLPLRQIAPQRVSGADFRSISVAKERQYETIRGGQRYQVIEFKDVLIPLKAGSLASPQFDLKVQVVEPTQMRRPSGNVWDLFQGGFFNMGRAVEKNVRLKTTKLQVKALPEAGKPADFSDLVGRFSLSAKVDPKALKEGESAQVTITLQGDGSLDHVDIPTTVWEKSGRIYSESPKLSESLTANGDFISQKTFSFALVPHANASTIALDAVNISFFDPQEKAYRSLTADLGELTVRAVPGGAPAAPQAPAAAPATPPVSSPEEPRLDLATLVLAAIPRSLWLVGAVSIMILLGVGIYFWQRSKQTLEPASTSSEKPLSIPLPKAPVADYRRGLELLRTHSTTTDVKQIYDSLAKTVALVRGSDDKALTTEEVLQFFVAEHLPDDLLQEVRRVVTHIEKQKFSGGLAAEPLSLVSFPWSRLQEELEKKLAPVWSKA